MSAMNVFHTGREGCVITDSVTYDVSGNVLGFAPKTFLLPHFRSIVSCRGRNSAVLQIINLLCEDFLPGDSVDSLVSAVQEKSRIVHRVTSETQKLEIMVAGWSSQKNATNVNLFASDSDFERLEIPEGTIFAGPDNFKHPAMKFPKNFMKDPYPYMIEVVKSQRELAVNTIGHNIGGAIVATEFNKFGATQKVIHRIDVLNNATNFAAAAA